MSRKRAELEAVKSYLHLQQEGFESKRSSKIWRMICLLLQLVMGATLLFSGVVKGIDPIGTAIKIGEYATSVGISLPMWLSEGGAIFLNVLEALLGTALLLGLMPRITSLLTLVLMGGMTLITLYILLYQPVSDCGCFGDALKISNSATFVKNIFFLLFALLLWIKRSRWVRLLSDGADLILVVVAATLLIHFNLYPLSHLPVVDFRPYKVGRSLEELTLTNGEEGLYEHRYIYAKDGEERAYGIEELGEVEEGGNFVRDETITIREAKQPEGLDFILLDDQGNNVVPHFIEKGDDLLLLFSRDLSRWHRRDVQKMASLMERYSWPFYIVSSQPRDLQQRDDMQPLLAASAGSLFLDHTTSVTALRSDPGVMAISRGVIQNKWTLTDFLKQANSTRKVQALFEPRSILQKGWRYLASFGPLLLFALVVLVAGAIHRRQLRELRGGAKGEQFFEVNE